MIKYLIWKIAPIFFNSEDYHSYGGNLQNRRYSQPNGGYYDKNHSAQAAGGNYNRDRDNRGGPPHRGGGWVLEFFGFLLPEITWKKLISVFNIFFFNFLYFLITCNISSIIEFSI